MFNTPKDAAKALKKELALKFPGIVFQVRSNYLASGNTAIDVEYGPVDSLPTLAEVREVADRYRDSDIDLSDAVIPDPKHVITEEGMLKEHGGVTYVTVVNHLSKDVR